MGKWTPRDNKVDLRVGIIGDSHILRTETDGAWFREAVKAYSIIGKNQLDALAFIGDIIYENKKEELFEDIYDIVYSVIDEYAKDIPIIYTVGNHEFPQGNKDSDMTKRALELFIRKTGQNPNYSTVINGYHFITAGCTDYYCGALPRETENWIMNEIDSAIEENAEKPVFLMFHNPIPEMFAGIFNLPSSYSDELIAFLKNRPQVINLCAHCHTAARLVQNIWQDGFTAFHTPMAGGGCLEEIECDCSGHFHPHEASFLEVTGSLVKIYSIDLITGSYVSEPWEIDIKGILNGTAEFSYTNEKKNNPNAPYFSPEDEIIISGITDSRAVISFPRGKCEPWGKLNDNFVRAHRIIVTEKETGNEIINVLYQSDFYEYAPSPFLTRVLEGLHWETSYTVSVTPMSVCKVFGTQLTAEFTTR